jgi:hypothetical protein
MTSEENAIYRTLLTQRTTIEKYADGPIPLRVMQIVAHARGTGDERVGYLEIWHEPTFKDPILVGRKNSYGDPYMLARWGTTLAGLPELREMARKKLLPKAQAWVGKVKSLVAELPGTMEARVDLYLTGEKDDWRVPSYEFS